MKMKWDPYAESAIWQTYAQSNPELSYHSFAKFVQLQCQDSNLKAKFIQELKLLRSYASLKKANRISWNLYYVLCVAGGVYALCSGFDGMVSVLSLLLPHLGLGILIGLGLLSALSALGIFIARDRPSIMETLDLEHDPYHHIIDEYLYHVQAFNHQAIDQKWRPGQQFNQEYRTAHQLKVILEDKACLNQEKKSLWWVGAQAQVVMFIGAVLFFSDGFFVGENVALLLAPLFCIESISFTLILSITMGLFALAAYWYVERASLKDYLYNHVATDEYLREEYAKENLSDLRQISIFQPAANQELQAELVLVV